MKKSVTLYQKSTKGKLTFWTGTLDGNTISIEWGYVGADKSQSKVKTIKGKKYTTPEQQAELEFDREIDDRLKSGYFKSKKEAEAADYSADIDLASIPDGFHPAKPISSKPVANPEAPSSEHKLDASLAKLYKEGRLLFQRKANGIRGYFVKVGGKVRLYSRTLEDMTEHFPEMVCWLSELSLPDKSMLDLEVTMDGGFTFSDCMLIQGLAPGSADKAKDTKKNAISAQERMRGLAKMDLCYCAAIFDVIYWAGEAVNRSPYSVRRAILRNKLNIPQETIGKRPPKLFLPMEYINFEEATAAMSAGKWEGLVIWDKNMVGGFTTNGKPKRLKGCWKWKATLEDDFFVTGAEPEAGNPENVGALLIAQYDSESNVIPCGRVGSGLKKEDRKAAWDWKGKVFEIAFDTRMKANARGERCLQFPRLVRERTDKKPKECILQDMDGE